MTDTTRKPTDSAQEPTATPDSYSQGDTPEHIQPTEQAQNRDDDVTTTHAGGNSSDTAKAEYHKLQASENHDKPNPNSKHADKKPAEGDVGGNTSAGSSSRGESEGETPRAREGRASLTNRWQAEGRFGEASAFMDEIRKAYREEHKGKQGPMTRKELTEYAWQEAARAFPPLEPPEPEPQAEKAHAAPNTPNSGESARVQGLGDIPQDWPQLPENASLQAELGWCQANRLRIVEELPSGSTRVHLDKAGTPAPSMAALGWLETSIRSYAKYVDVVARALSSQADNEGIVKRERVKIERIRELLREMRADADDDAGGAGAAEKC